MVASIGGNLESVKLLLDRGAKASVRTPKVFHTVLLEQECRPCMDCAFHYYFIGAIAALLLLCVSNYPQKTM